MAKRGTNPNVVKLNRTYDATQLAACCERALIERVGRWNLAIHIQHTCDARHPRAIRNPRGDRSPDLCGRCGRFEGHLPHVRELLFRPEPIEA